MSKKLVLLAGPTASGKSNLAIKLAKKLNGEIINADSMQIFKELKILTARPHRNDLKNITHHLYGFKSVKEHYSTGNWLKDAKLKITNIKKKNKIPILVGGTGLYFKALVDGMVKIPDIPLTIRNRIRKKQSKIGQIKFYSELIKLDPLCKKKINKNDSQRSIRAYEVKKFTNKSLFDWYSETYSDFNQDSFIRLHIDYPRDKLIERISLRTNEMLRDGAIKEAKRFYKLRVKKDLSSNKVIGLSEIKEYLEKRIDLIELKEKISIKTRQYAKRQSTWARGQMSDWQKIKFNRLEKFLKKFPKSS